MISIVDTKQIDGQIGFDGKNLTENEILITEKNKPLIVDENGSPVTLSEMVTKNPMALNNDDLQALDLLKPGKFDIRNFHTDFKDNTKRVLLQLLSMQSNDKPLKKGGEGIAYRCDALILKNRQHFTDIENTLLDVFLGIISTSPDDKAYFIYPKDVARILGMEDETYAYKLMKKAVETLSDKPLKFMIPLENGKQRVLKVPWYDSLTYIKEDELMEGESVGISFTPTDFFKMLTISSTISHGAHYSSRVAYMIQGQYAKMLFHYIESNKGYCAYPGATPGWFKKSIDEIQNEILNCPQSYRWADINRRAFKPCKDAIDNHKDVDFTFDYKKSGNDIFFMISKKIEMTENPMISDKDKDTVIAILKGNGLLENEANLIYKHYKENSRDIVFLTQALTSIAFSKNIKSRAAVLCSIMDKGLSKDNATLKPSAIEQRDYDFEELETMLLNQK